MTRVVFLHPRTCSPRTIAFCQQWLQAAINGHFNSIEPGKKTQRWPRVTWVDIHETGYECGLDTWQMAMARGRQVSKGHIRGLRPSPGGWRGKSCGSIFFLREDTNVARSVVGIFPSLGCWHGSSRRKDFSSQGRSRGFFHRGDFFFFLPCSLRALFVEILARLPLARKNLPSIYGSEPLLFLFGEGEVNLDREFLKGYPLTGYGYFVAPSLDAHTHLFKWVKERSADLTDFQGKGNPRPEFQLSKCVHLKDNVEIGPEGVRPQSTPFSIAW